MRLPQRLSGTRPVPGSTFAGRTVVVTGAGSGIGRALAVRLARCGARVAISDVSSGGLEETARLCRDLGAETRTYVLDVADREAVVAHADEVVADLGTVHLVVNNAGVALHGSVSELSPEDFHWLMDIDFWGVVHGTQAFLPHLVASGDGYLVNISSVFGLIGVPKQAAYNAAKFAVRGFTESLRQEVAIDGVPVHVSCVHPGGIKTNVARSARLAGVEDAVRIAATFDKAAVTTADRAALVILRGVERGRSRILVGPDAWLMAGLPRVLGAYYQPLVVRYVRKLLY